MDNGRGGLRRVPRVPLALGKVCSGMQLGFDGKSGQN